MYGVVIVLEIYDYQINSLDWFNSSSWTACWRSWIDLYSLWRCGPDWEFLVCSSMSTPPLLLIIYAKINFLAQYLAKIYLLDTIITETYTLEYIIGVLKTKTGKLSKENYVSILIKVTYPKSREALGGISQCFNHRMSLNGLCKLK